MSIEKMREEFEAAYAKDYESVRGLPMKAEDLASMRDGDHYGVSRGYLNGCWWGWQASRAALMVELPPNDGDDGDSWDPCWKAGVAQCREAIEAAGVKVKP